jgi:hypothetical protein
MEMNVENTKAVTFSRLPSSTQIKMQQKQQENLECFNNMCSVITNGARCRPETKCRIVMIKAAFDQQGSLFTSKLDINVRKKLVKCYICNTDFYGAESLILRKVDQKYAWK